MLVMLLSLCFLHCCQAQMLRMMAGMKRNVWFDSGYFFSSVYASVSTPEEYEKIGSYSLEVTSGFVPGSSLCLVRQRIQFASVYVSLSSPGGVREIGFFWETTFGIFSCIQRYLVRQWIYVCVSSEVLSVKSVDTPVIMLDSLVQTVLGQVVDVPVVVQRQVRGLSVQTAVLVPQLPFIAGRRHPGHGAEADSHCFPCSEDH